MYYKFCLLFILFVIYSFIGYLIEITSVSRIEKKFVWSRGYLIGPYLPIFGFGALAMTFLLNQYKDQVITLFVLSLVVCCTLEYFTSLIMELIFHLRWWDYSDKKFNINGRVCLENGIGFGFSGVILVRYIQPFFLKMLSSWNINTVIIIGSILLGIILFDFIFSTVMVLKLKSNIHLLGTRDATGKIREEIRKSLEKYDFFNKRIMGAFPNIRNNEGFQKLHEYFESRQKEKK